MITQTLRSLSLSTDEMALVFSLINIPDVGKSLLSEAYGNLSATRIEDKMVTASHSLLSRGAASISSKGTIVLDPTLETFFAPFAHYKNMIQMLLNHGEEGGLTAVNYHIGQVGVFTSNEVDLGVIHRIMHGGLDDLANVILSRLQLPQAVPANIAEALERSRSQIKMKDYIEAEKKGEKAANAFLKSNGVDPQVADLLCQDTATPVTRGSVTVVDVSTEMAQKKKYDQTGEGFFFLMGKYSSWIMAFDRGDENTHTTILPGTAQQALTLLERAVQRIR